MPQTLPNRSESVSTSKVVDIHSKPTLTVNEVAELMAVSHQTVRRLFENERGVIVLDRPEKTHKRGYKSIRIPRFVYERVITRISVK